MNLEEVTIEECIDKFDRERQTVIINDGKIVEFVYDCMGDCYE